MSFLITHIVPPSRDTITNQQNNDKEAIMMKNKNTLSQDELRQKVDGFSMKPTDDKPTKNGYKIVDEPLYPANDQYNKTKNHI
jgi:hypothetical protein